MKLLYEVHDTTSDGWWSALKRVVSMLFQHSLALDEHFVPEPDSEPSPPTFTSFTDLTDRSTTIIRSWPPGHR